MAVGDEGWQGGIQYIINILNALDKLETLPAIEVHLFKHAGQQFKDLEKFRKIKIVVRDIDETLPGWSFSNRLRWFVQRRFFSRVNPRLENYLIANQFDYVFPATLSDGGKKLNTGSWIADFQYKYFPDGSNPEINDNADRVISFIAGHTDKIVLSSKYCEEDCHRFFPATKNKTHTMPFAVFIDDRVMEFQDFSGLREKYELPEKFLLISNLFAPTKNHETVFHALGILKEQGKRIPLVCTGNIHDYAKPEYANEVLQMLTKYKIRDQVYLLGLIPRIEQVNLFRMAVALVQPSLSEGWSTFVEEAKALGKQILLSDIPVHREQSPDFGIYFGPTDAKELSSKIAIAWDQSASSSFPDLATEKRAMQKYNEFVLQFGKRFLQIAALEN